MCVGNNLPSLAVETVGMVYLLKSHRNLLVSNVFKNHTNGKVRNQLLAFSPVCLYFKELEELCMINFGLAV